MLSSFKTCMLALALVAGIGSANAEMSGPSVTREEFVSRLDDLSFPWALAERLGVEKSLQQFDRLEDVKALQDQLGDPLPYVVFAVVAYDADGYFSVDVWDYPSIAARDFDVGCRQERLAGYRQAKETDILFYYGAGDLRVFEVSRYVPSDTPDDQMAILNTMANESVECAFR